MNLTRKEIILICVEIKRRMDEDLKLLKIAIENGNSPNETYYNDDWYTCKEIYEKLERKLIEL